MEFSELMMLSDEEKIKYLRELDVKLDQEAELDILNSTMDDGIDERDIFKYLALFNLESSLKYSEWLNEGNISFEDFGDELKEIYEQFFKDSNDEEILENIDLDTIDIFELKVKVIESLKDDQLKIDYIENIDNSDVELAQKARIKIIKSLKNDQLKVDYLERLDFNEYEKSNIISSLSKDNLKVEYLERPDFNEYQKSNIISSLSKDNLKVEYLEKVKDEYPPWAMAMIITSLPDESLRLSYLDKVKDNCSPYVVATIVSTFADDEVKVNFLKSGESFGDKDVSSRDRTIIIKSLKSDQLKIDCLNNSEFNLALHENSEIIESLKSDQSKMDYLTNSEIDLNSLSKLQIIGSFSEEQLKIDCLSNPNIGLTLSDKADLISTLTDDEFKFNFLKTDESFRDEDSTSSETAKIIKSLKSDQLKIDCLTDSDFELTSYDKGGIIETLTDVQLKIECLTNSDIGLNSFDKGRIIGSFSEEQLKIDCLSNPNIELEIYDKVEIIRSLESDQLKFDYLDKFNSKLDEYQKVDIITSLSEDILIAEYLETFKNEFSPMAIGGMVTSLEDELLRMDCLEKVRDKCTISVIAKIVSTLTDDEVKLNFLKTDKTFRGGDASSEDKEIIIKSLLDSQLKIDCLTNSNLGLDSYSKGEIIETLKDEQLKIECVTNSDINLRPFDKARVISTLTDDEVKLNFLKNDENFGDKDVSSSNKTIVIRSLTDNQLKIDCLTNSDLELTSFDKGEIIKSLTEEQLKVDCLFDPNIELEPYHNGQIVMLLKEEQLKIDCLANPNIELESSDKARLISTLIDDKVKLKYIEDSSIGFNELDKEIMIWSLQDEKKIEEFGVLPDKSYKKALDLPSNMTIGVEIEAEGANVETFNFIGHILGGWKPKRDGSLRDGVEVVSPILHSTEEDMYSIAKVCNIMQKLGLNTSERCGGHIHFGADFFGSDPKTWENFYTIYNECEEIFYKISNETGQVSRPGVLRYAMTSNDVFAKMFETGDVSIQNQEDFDKVLTSLKKSRYRGVNVANLGNDGKNTIEFRMPNGTLNPKVIRENIKLFGSLLQVSKEMALDPEYRREEFEAIKHKDLSEKEKTEALLNILFDDEQEKDIYRERWDAVKDNETFEQLKAANPTFIRGDYSMKEESKEFFEEVGPEDRVDFIQEVRRELDNSRDRITEAQER